MNNTMKYIALLVYSIYIDVYLKIYRIVICYIDVVQRKIRNVFLLISCASQ